MPFPGRWLRRKPPPAPLDLVNHAVAGQIDAIAALGVILSARGLVTREETLRRAPVKAVPFGAPLASETSGGSNGVGSSSNCPIAGNHSRSQTVLPRPLRAIGNSSCR